MLYQSHRRGSAFHRLLRARLADGYHPTPAELEIVAGKIWQDGFSFISGRNWADIEPGSDDHSRMIDAARMALGVEG